MRLRAAVVVGCALATLGSEPGAQTADAVYAEARSRFSEAVAAVQAGRPSDAVGLFERSYAARPAPVVAVNLAICLRGLGRLGDARRWYLRFLDTATPEDLARHGATVHAHLDEITRRLARVSRGDGVPASVSVLLDGSPLTAEPRWIDPGEHLASASEPGRVGGVLAFTARAGEVLRMTPRLSPVPAATPITQRWWFWTAVGVAVAGVTSAVLVPSLQGAPPGYGHPEVVVP